MRRIGTIALLLCAASLAPAFSAEVFVIDPVDGGDCTSLSGVWDPGTTTCSITQLTISAGDELVVESQATVVAGGLAVWVYGILRLLPGSTFNNSLLIQPGGLFVNETSVAAGSLQVEPGATGINSGTISLNAALSGGLQTEGRFVNTGTIRVLANATFNFNGGVLSNTGLLDIVAYGFYNFGAIYNCGGTISGAIEDTPPVSEADADGDGVCDSADCAPGNGDAWTRPRAVRDLRLNRTGVTAELSWTASTPDGAGDILYDVISSTDPADFQTGAICVETDAIDSVATDATPAPPGGLIAYLVRAEGVCGEAEEDASEPRDVRPCP